MDDLASSMAGCDRPRAAINAVAATDLRAIRRPATALKSAGTGITSGSAVGLRMIASARFES